MRALGRKKTCFFNNARPKSNARVHLKQRKKHSGLTPDSGALPGAITCVDTPFDSEHDMLGHCMSDAGLPSTMLARHQMYTWSMQ